MIMLGNVLINLYFFNRVVQLNILILPTSIPINNTCTYTLKITYIYKDKWLTNLPVLLNHHQLTSLQQLG